VLREFLYVDVVRVRSLLAQLDRGVVDTVVEKTTLSKGTDLGASVVGLRAGRLGEETTGSEEARSLQDMLFTVFDEIIQSQGMVRDLPIDLVSNPESWDSSTLHESLIEGELLRLFTPITIVDPQFVKDRVERFSSINDALSKFGHVHADAQIANLEKVLRAAMDAEIAQVPVDRRARARKELDSKLKTTLRNARQEMDKSITDPVTPELAGIFDVINQFLTSDAISVRFPACGEARPELAFAGSLLGRSNYIQREREALFSRYGSTLKGWTSVVQVATVPSNADAIAARDRDFSQVNFSTEEGVNRAGLEQTVIQMLGMLEARGMAEGPLWPGISVIPLGIYRVVPRSDLPEAE